MQHTFSEDVICFLLSIRTISLCLWLRSRRS